jgi:DNA topoisomerase I
LLEQLVHNGVIVPDPPDLPGLSIVARGHQIALTPKLEEMALAWARKKDTPYVRDEMFVANFMRDFSEVLGIDPPLRLDEVDFGAYYDLIDEERRQKEALTAEERKAQAAARRVVREDLKERYGYAIVNGQRVELGTYMVEPSGIFMGRGQHPLRGRWKEGASQEDITLNYGPNPEEMEGNWAEVVWQPESLWVARWKDKLSGKLKYIWLSDTAPINQRRELEKFDQALRLDSRLKRVRETIEESLVAEGARERMVATACYLIDILCLRVGDEKEADEADTVGATTLRPEHVTLHDDGSVEFRFLGKDSVEWHKTIQPPRVVYDNLAELILHARPSSTAASTTSAETAGNGRGLPQLFPNITSQNVNAFLSSIVPGLSAKMFRTFHATKVVERSLNLSKIKPEHPEYRKWKAASIANLRAAELCNHTKQETGNWERTQTRYEERIAGAKERKTRYSRQVTEFRQRLEELKVEAAEAEEKAPDPERKTAVRQRYAKRLAAARRRIEAARGRLSRAQDALGKVEAQYEIARSKRYWNPSTSLKSYVDPRVYQRWGQKVDYDVLNSFYPATLRRKYAWVQDLIEDDLVDSDLEIRPSLPSDLAAIIDLLYVALDGGVLDTLPQDAEALEKRLIPNLESGWRETVIVLNEEDDVVGLGSLGPVRFEDEQPLIDCLAVLHPDYRDEDSAAALGAELARRFERFAMQYPRKRSEEPYALSPCEADWCTCAPGIAEHLGLAVTEGVVEEAEDEE